MKDFSKEKHHTTEDSSTRYSIESETIGSGHDDSGPFIKKTEYGWFQHRTETFGSKKLRIVSNIAGMIFMFAMAAPFFRRYKSMPKEAKTFFIVWVVGIVVMTGIECLKKK